MLIKYFISCFPHVINIAVKAGLKHLTKLGTTYDQDIDYQSGSVLEPQALQDDIAYWQALKDDAVSAARNLVGACRASGLRREDLADIISAGNERGGWDKLP